MSYPSIEIMRGFRMLDHIGIRVSDYERSKRFFEVALEPLGYRLHKEGC